MPISLQIVAEIWVIEALDFMLKHMIHWVGLLGDYLAL